jgi:hypothetical protein
VLDAHHVAIVYTQEAKAKDAAPKKPATKEAKS